MAFFSRNHIENKFSILEIYLQCDFRYLKCLTKNTYMHRHTCINYLIELFELKNPSYLEIGVWEGDTFKHINTNNKDGVDPGQYCDSPYVNYKMTSDDFFKINTKKYDMIFIDGLHTAYQVTKDIYNSINALNDGGIIILDDVYPHAESEQQCLDLNRYGSQTGDVWKAVYHLLDRFVEMCDIILFTDKTERGSFVLKLKKNNTKNIEIDSRIPTSNYDGKHAGPEAEWNLYTWSKDFQTYVSRLKSFSMTS
jgi:hypothetical protein